MANSKIKQILVGTTTYDIEDTGAAHLSTSNTFTGNNVFQSNTNSFVGSTNEFRGGTTQFLTSATEDYDPWASVSNSGIMCKTTGGTTYYKYGIIEHNGNEIGLPSKAGSIALTDDIDVTAAGNNTFTGINIFHKEETATSGDKTISEAKIDPGPTAPLILLETKTVAPDGLTITGNATIRTDSIVFSENGTGYTTSMTRDGFKVDQAGVYTDYHNGSIIHTTAGPSYAKQTLRFPDKSGTIAVTSDIPEAKLNENIIKNPDKTYLVWKGNQFPNSTDAIFKAPAGGTIDWGDGNVETFGTASTVVNTHNYTDGIDYHLISLSNYTLVGESAFHNCNGLTSVIIVNGVKSIGYNAFKGCDGLTNVIIPGSVTSIAKYAFQNCSGLTSVTIPDSVTIIDNRAFFGCNKLKTIRISAINPPALGHNVFETSLEKIIVPKSAINTYKSAAGWSTYANKIVYEVDSTDISDTSNFAKLSGNNTFTGTNTFSSGYLQVGNDSTNITLYDNGIESGGIRLLFNSPSSGTFNYKFPCKKTVDEAPVNIVTENEDNTFTGTNTFRSGNTYFMTAAAAEHDPYVRADAPGIWCYAGYNSDPTVDAFTSYHNGRIVYKSDAGTSPYTLLLPSKGGTIALTRDIPIKTATLSGTTLRITLS